MATEYVGLSTEANRGVDATVTSQCIARVTNGSHGVSELYRIVVNVYMTSALCIIGFIGNGLSLAVLCKDKRERNSSTNWLLQTLAVVDTVYLVTCLFIQPIKVWHSIN